MSEHDPGGVAVTQVGLANEDEFPAQSQHLRKHFLLEHEIAGKPVQAQDDDDLELAFPKRILDRRQRPILPTDATESVG